MIFKYTYIGTFLNEINIEDIGNCSLVATTEFDNKYILVIDTMLGYSRVFYYGPINPDLDLLPQSSSCSFKRIEFSERKLQKEINNFLNIRNINKVETVDAGKALNYCKDFIQYMKQRKFY